MNENKLFSFHYFIRTLILLGFSSYIVHLAKSDALQYYIAPRMMIFVKASAVALYVIACFQGYSALRAYWGKRIVCGCEQPPSKSALRNLLSYGLLILPLLIGFLLPNTALGSAMAATKGMNLSAAKSTVAKQRPGTANNSNSTETTGANNQPDRGSNPSPEPSVGSSATAPISSPASPADKSVAGKTDAELQKMFQADNEWDEDFSKIGIRLYKKDLIVVKPSIYMEILSSIDLFKNNFIGKKIELSGFVYREENMKNDQFVVGRFAVSCCSADASPYGVLVEFPTAQNYPKDTWVNVTGAIQNGSYKGNDIFTIKATHIEKITAPDSPYVYPNFEPLKDLD